MQYRCVKGMSDIYLDEMSRWQFIEEKARSFFSARVYEEIRTPVVEYTELFCRSIGEASDIVSKEMYSFEDRGGRSLTLRPEMTASVIRAVIENNLLKKREPLKLLYMGPMFRAERPQAGRKRQFYQIGVEVIGDASPLADAMLIRDAANFLKALGLKENEFSITINNVGCSECRPAFLDTLRSFCKERLDELCNDCTFRYEKNVLRIFDCKNPACKKIISSAPKVSEHVCETCAAHYAQMQRELDRFSVAYTSDPSIVRGLDYYTSSVFEITSSKLGAQDAIGAGGRYNNLMQELGGPQKGATGFALGVERLLMCLEDELKDYSSPALQKTVYVAYAKNEYCEQAKDVISSLENAGIATYSDCDARSLKGQLKRANKLGFRWVLILNEGEVEAGKVTLKDLSREDNNQELVRIDDVVDVMKRKF